LRGLPKQYKLIAHIPIMRDTAENDVEEGLITYEPVENERAIVAFCIVCVIVTLSLCVGGLFLINYLFDKKTWI
jgi:hypothetical protein